MPNTRDGHVDWRDWSLDWAVSDHEGLALFGGFFRGVRIIGKFSLPVIRVKYEKDGGPADVGSWVGGVAGGAAGAAAGAAAGGVPGAIVGGLVGMFGGRETEWGLGAGPYADQIHWAPAEKRIPYIADRNTYGLVKNEFTNHEYVGIVEYADEKGKLWLRLNVYARIGAYHIVQEWHLGDSGEIIGRVGSKGVAINMSHTHHPYWRLDFDIDTTENRAYAVSNGEWLLYSTEANDTKDMPRDKKWVVRNEFTRNQAWIFPEADAGSDGFSTLDVAVRRFHPHER